MGYPTYTKYNMSVTGESLTQKLMQIIGEEDVVNHVKTLHVRNNNNVVGINNNESSRYVTVDVSFDDAATLAKVQTRLLA